MRQGFKSNLFFRGTFDEHFPVYDRKVVTAAFQFGRSQLQRFFSDLLRRLRDGVARCHHHPARKSPYAVRNARAVAGHYPDIVKINAEIVSANLSQSRFLSLTLRCRAGENINFPIRSNLYASALKGSEPRSFDIGRDAQTQADATLTRIQLRTAKIFVSDHFQ